MAKTENTTSNQFDTANWSTYTQGMTENAKEVMGWQVRTTHMMFDHAMKFGQTLADFYQTQATEGLKFSQTMYKTGMGWADEYRRHVTTLTEKANRVG